MSYRSFYYTTTPFLTYLENGQTYSLTNYQGYRLIEVFMVGGGGGGGSAPSSSGYGGGGGGQGSFAYYKIPLKYGDTIKIVAGAGGSPGQNGGDSYVLITDINGNTYQIGAHGGQAGGDGTSSSAGSGGNGGITFINVSQNAPTRYVLLEQYQFGQNGTSGSGSSGGAGAPNYNFDEFFGIMQNGSFTGPLLQNVGGGGAGASVGGSASAGIKGAVFVVIT